MEGIKEAYGSIPKNVIADAGYSSEENYEYLKEQEIGAYIKYNMFHMEQMAPFKRFQLMEQPLICKPIIPEIFCSN